MKNLLVFRAGFLDFLLADVIGFSCELAFDREPSQQEPNIGDAQEVDCKILS